MYTVFLKEMQLPVAPGKIDTRVAGRNRTWELMDGGEVNILKSPGLTEIRFSALLPAFRYPFASYPDGFKEQGYYLEYLERLKTRRKPFSFIVSRARPNGVLLFDTNIRVSLEEYTLREDAGEGFDLVADVALKQYRAPGAKRVKIEGDSMEIPESRERDSAPETASYRVVRGDSLWEIAKRFLGDGSRYKEIYALNQAQIDARNKGHNVAKYTIYAGQEFQLPG